MAEIFLPLFITLIQLLFIEELLLLKAPRRSKFWLRAPLFCVGAVGIIALYSLIVLYTSNVFIVSYLLVYLLAGSVAIGCYKINILGAVFSATASYALQHAGYDIFTLATINAENPFDLMWISYLIPFVLGIGAYFLAMRRFPKCYDNVDYFNVCIAVVVLMVSIFIDRGVDSKKAMILVTVYDLIICLFCFIFQFSISFGKQKKKESAVMQEMLEKEYKMHEMNSQSIQAMNIKFHDLNNNITKLRQALENSSGDETREIEAISRTVRLYGHTADSGNSTLDSVIMEKSLICEINKIPFSYIVDGKQLEFMEAVDIFSLFNNVLDNAIEREIKEDEDKRVIALRVSRTGDMILISVENYIGKPVKLVDGFPVSDKDDRVLHGHGIIGVKSVVQKYNGNLRITQDDNMFVVSMVFESKVK